MGSVASIANSPVELQGVKKSLTLSIIRSADEFLPVRLGCEPGNAYIYLDQIRS